VDLARLEDRLLADDAGALDVLLATRASVMIQCRLSSCAGAEPSLAMRTW
jgi:hypothetical protein